MLSFTLFAYASGEKLYSTHAKFPDQAKSFVFPSLALLQKNGPKAGRGKGLNVVSPIRCRVKRDTVPTLHQGNLILRELAKPKVHHGPRGSPWGVKRKGSYKKNFCGSFFDFTHEGEFPDDGRALSTKKALTLRLQTICKPSVACPGCK